MNILVIGGNRFTGKLLVEKLFSKGHSITVINRRGIAPVACNVIKCDRNDTEKLELLMQGRSFDCVIDMCLFNIQQAKATVKMFNNKIEKYIFISSVAVYKESASFPIDENSTLGLWPMFGSYGLDKLLVENYFESIKDFPFINLRPTYIIGKDNHLNREGYYFDKISKGEKIDIEKDGEAILSFVFVEDVADIIYEIIIKKVVLRESYNICNDEFITIKEFILMICNILGKVPVFNEVPEIVSFKNEHCFFSNKKIKNDFKFEFKSLKQGLTELSKSYQNKTLH